VIITDSSSRRHPDVVIRSVAEADLAAGDPVAAGRARPRNNSMSATTPVSPVPPNLIVFCQPTVFEPELGGYEKCTILDM
jgi:hypothetical protein